VAASFGPNLQDGRRAVRPRAITMGGVKWGGAAADQLESQSEGSYCSLFVEEDVAPVGGKIGLDRQGGLQPWASVARHDQVAGLFLAARAWSPAGRHRLVPAPESRTPPPSRRPSPSNAVKTVTVVSLVVIRAHPARACPCGASCRGGVRVPSGVNFGRLGGCRDRKMGKVEQSERCVLSRKRRIGWWVTNRHASMNRVWSPWSQPLVIAYHLILEPLTAGGCRTIRRGSGSAKRSPATSLPTWANFITVGKRLQPAGHVVRGVLRALRPGC